MKYILFLVGLHSKEAGILVNIVYFNVRALDGSSRRYDRFFKY